MMLPFCLLASVSMIGVNGFVVTSSRHTKIQPSSTTRTTLATCLQSSITSNDFGGGGQPQQQQPSPAQNSHPRSPQASNGNGSPTSLSTTTMASTTITTTSVSRSSPSMDWFQSLAAGMVVGDASVLLSWVVVASMTMTVSAGVVAVLVASSSSSYSTTSMPWLAWHEWMWAARDGYLGTMVSHALRHGGQL
ncbi:hypothetical protein ACA910_018805 [Epithemia clementina (nom. ined.)]